jgi:hypothetical protein
VQRLRDKDDRVSVANPVQPSGTSIEPTGRLVDRGAGAGFRAAGSAEHDEPARRIRERLGAGQIHSHFACGVRQEQPVALTRDPAADVLALLSGTRERRADEQRAGDDRPQRYPVTRHRARP